MSSPAPEASPSDWLRLGAALRPGSGALVTAGQRLDFAGLWRYLGRTSARLAEISPEPCLPTAVLSRSAARIARALYLALYAGFPLLPLDPDRSAATALLRQCSIRRAFCDAGLVRVLPPGIEPLPAEWLDETAAVASLPPDPLPTDRIQLLLASSGTSGASPRAAMFRGAALAAAAQASRARLGLDEGDTWLACLPLWHIGGLSILLRCLHAGARALVHERFDAALLWRDLQTERVSHLSLVPAMLSRLLERCSDAPPPSSLRILLVGGGPLSESLARRARAAGWPLCPTYGLTEACSQVATLPALAKVWRAGDVGPPLPGTQVRILDAAGHPTSGIGRISIRGPSLMAGYALADGSLGAGLRNDAFDSADLGWLDERGHLHILGRADATLVSGGENIQPEEIEALILGCPGVAEAAVSARADPIWGDRLVAVFVGAITAAALEQWSRRHLPSRIRPREFISVPQLPRNALGKTDRRAVRALLAAEGSPEDPAP